MEYKGLKAYAIITLVASAVMNFLHLFWTIWICVEQAKTGWGYGTSMEMLALLPWLFEVVAIPVVISVAVFIVLSLIHQWKKKLFLWNVFLIVLLIAQVVIFNIFLYY